MLIDEETYVYTSPNSDATPSFEIEQGNQPSYAAHVLAAQASGLPGDETPLTRIPDSGRIQANDRTACPASLPRPAGRACDQYPFAETGQGANEVLAGNGGAQGRTFPGCGVDQLPQGVTGPGWSTCMIDSRQSAAVKNSLNLFFRANRVLPGDAFHTRIVHIDPE